MGSRKRNKASELKEINKNKVLLNLIIVLRRQEKCD